MADGRGGRHGGNQGGGNNNPHGDNQFAGTIARVTVVASSSDTNRQARQRARQVRRDDAARQRAVQRQRQAAAPPTPRPEGPGKFKRALSAIHKQSMTTESNQKYQVRKTLNQQNRAQAVARRAARRAARNGGSGDGE